MKLKEVQPFEKLSKPAQRALAGAGIHSLEQLAALSEREFMHLHGIGKNTLIVLKQAMTGKGLSFTEK